MNLILENLLKRFNYKTKVNIIPKQRETSIILKLDYFILE